MKPPTEKTWWEATLDLSSFEVREETSTQLFGWHNGNYITILKSSLND